MISTISDFGSPCDTFAIGHFSLIVFKITWKYSHSLFVRNIPCRAPWVHANLCNISDSVYQRIALFWNSYCFSIRVRRQRSVAFLVFWSIRHLLVVKRPLRRSAMRYLFFCLLSVLYIKKGISAGLLSRISFFSGEQRHQAIFQKMVVIIQRFWCCSILALFSMGTCFAIILQPLLATSIHHFLAPSMRKGADPRSLDEL